MVYPKDPTLRENEILRKYHVQKREDYIGFENFSFVQLSPIFPSYNKIVGSIKKLINELSKLDINDPFRIKLTEQFVEKL